jgi:hypothetical protein
MAVEPEIIRMDILRRGCHDILQLAEVASVIAKHLGAPPAHPAVLTATTLIIDELLSQGEVEVGDARTVDGVVTFIPWAAPQDEVMNRIIVEWTNLGRQPRLGEICWLANTALGNAHAC